MAYMRRMPLTCSGARPYTWTRSSRAPSRPSCRSSGGGWPNSLVAVQSGARRRRMGAWTTTPVQTAERISTFLWKVYSWMAIGLGLTAVVAFLVGGAPELLRTLVGNRLVFFGLVIAELGLVFYLSARAARLAPGVAAGLFALY